MTSLVARVAGVIRRPRATFAAVVNQPRWLDVLALTTVLAFALNAVLLNTEIGQLALVDQWERTAIAFGGTVDEVRYAQFHEWSERGTIYAAVTALISGPVLATGLALLLLVAMRTLGSRIGLTRLLAVVAHAGVILALRQVVATPLNYAFETMASPTTLVRFTAGLDEASPWARFLGVIDLFVVWWIVVLAIGVGTLVRRPARSLALAFTGAYVALALLLAVVMALSGGTA